MAAKHNHPVPSHLVYLQALAVAEDSSASLTDLVTDTLTDAANGITEVFSRSTGGIQPVWQAGRKAGKIDGAIAAAKLLDRCAVRNGLTAEQMMAALGVKPQ